MRIEIRTCIKCGETKEIPQKHKHATNTCSDCQRIASREYQRLEAIKEGRRVGTTGRVPYPLRNGYKLTGPLFKSMASKTYQCKDKSEWRQLIKERLDATLENEELMKWINAHDEDAPIKRQKKINIEYPDTRNLTWEDWEKMGFGTEGDD